MPGNYSIITRATGTILTAVIYNADHQNHVDNATPQGQDDYSANQTQMQAQTDPGALGSEVLPTSTAGEFERIRFAIARLAGTTYWYQNPGLVNSILNPEFYS